MDIHCIIREQWFDHLRPFDKAIPTAVEILLGTEVQCLCYRFQAIAVKMVNLFANSIFITAFATVAPATTQPVPFE